jgi:predicted glycosyltransferase
MANILIDIGHPAHVHLFRNLYFYLKKQKHLVVVTSREKDVTNRLLDHYGMASESLSKAPSDVFRMSGELIKRDVKIFGLHKKHRFEVALGTSVCIAHLSAISQVRSYVFEEDDDDVVPVFSAITYPFTTGIVVPSCIRFKRWKSKRIFHDSLHELAYLHPDQFSPDESVLKKYDLKPKEYVVVRYSALRAHHDIGMDGIGTVWEKIQSLFQEYKIVSSQEGTGETAIAPWDMHHILHFSKLLVSDSQTMTLEASCLGVPSIRFNSFVGKISCMNEVEEKYQLSFGFKPDESEGMFMKLKELLADEELEEKWEEKRAWLLKDKPDFLQWQIQFIDSVL